MVRNGIRVDLLHQCHMLMRKQQTIKTGVLYQKTSGVVSISGKVNQMNFTDHQLELIQLAIEDYAFELDEEHANDCDEILTMIEAHFLNKHINPVRHDS